ncbi:hypothetical protein Bca52824_032588 [Brassica carinata]|uniref:Uncharacterized protein n=1 Tax=Brassica carinata TaxID=52824 RepID=A0A8X7SCS4_BRACI|nr:hypothetical protein Bca52824_032588 [Brassica carinata]
MAKGLVSTISVQNKEMLQVSVRHKKKLNIDELESIAKLKLAEASSLKLTKHNRRLREVDQTEVEKQYMLQKTKLKENSRITSQSSGGGGDLSHVLHVNGFVGVMEESPKGHLRERLKQQGRLKEDEYLGRRLQKNELEIWEVELITGIKARKVEDGVAAYELHESSTVGLVDETSSLS